MIFNSAWLKDAQAKTSDEKRIIIGLNTIRPRLRRKISSQQDIGYFRLLLLATEENSIAYSITTNRPVYTITTAAVADER